MRTESDNLQDYLKKSEVLDYDHKLIVSKCYELEKDIGEIEEKDEINLIKKSMNLSGMAFIIQEI